LFAELTNELGITAELINQFVLFIVIVHPKFKLSIGNPSIVIILTSKLLVVFNEIGFQRSEILNETIEPI